MYGYPPPGGPGVPGGPGAGNLLDESALPEWLRQGANGGYGAPPPGMGQPPYGGYPGAGAPGGFPPGGNAGYRAPSGDMTARSLIDDRALPGWMNQPPGAPGVAGQPGGGYGAREGLDARSLIDESSLPQWLQGGQSAAAQAAQWNPATGIQEPLPAWLAQPPVQPAAMFAPPPAPMAPPLGAQAMSAGQLADESALPDWLRAQGAGSAGRSAPAAPMGQAPRRPPNSEWLTDAHVPIQPAAGRGPGAAAPLGDAELPPWLRNNQQGNGSGAYPVPGQAGGMPNDQLPPWLRQGPGAGGADPPGGSTGRHRAIGGQRPGDPRDFTGSRVRRPDPRGQRQQAGYGMSGYPNQGYPDQWDAGDQGDGYPPDGYEDWQDDQQPSGRRRGGFLDRFRRR